MATNPDEYVIIKYVVDAGQALTDAQRMRDIINQSKADIKAMADQAKVGFKDVGKSLVESFKGLKFGDAESGKKLADFLKIDPDTIKSSTEFSRRRLEAINLIRTATTELGQEERRQASESAKTITSAKQQENMAQQEYIRSTKQGYDQILSPAAKAYGEQVQAVKQQIVSQSGATGQTYLQVAQQMQQAGVSAKVLNQSLKELQPTAQKTDSAFSNLGQTIQQALVIGIGLNLYNMIQQLISFLQQAAQSGRELMKAFFQLDVGIRAVRRAGIDITTPEMLENLDRLSEKFGVFSKKSLIEGSAALVNLVRDLGLTKDQIFQLQDAIATLAVVNGRSMEEVQRTVALALASGYTEGLQRLGVSINRVNIAARANAMGWKGGYTALTEYQRAQATLSLVMEKTGKYADDLTEYLKTQAGQLDATTAGIEDETAAIGQRLVPALLAWNNTLLTLLETFEKLFGIFGPFIDMINVISGTINKWTGVFTNLDDAKRGANIFERWKSGWGDLFGYVEREAARIAYKFPWLIIGQDDEAVKKMLDEKFDFSGLESKEVPVGEPDTTGGEGGEGGAVKETADYVRELHNDILEEQRRFTSRSKELERDYARDMDKIDRELARDLEEIWRDYWRKIDEIGEDEKRDLAEAQEENARDIVATNEDYNKKVDEANRKYQNDQIDAEKKFQEEMHRLREEFIFDLEGALQERDARQVLNLIRRYNLDKEQRQRGYELEQEERARQHQLEMEELARERDEKLAKLAEELALELEKIREQAHLKRVEAQRERDQDIADRELKAQQERDERDIRQQELIDELKIDAQERIDEIAAKLSEEKDMTAEKLAEIAAEYEKIYGLNGVLDMYMQNYIAILAARAGQIMGVLSRMMQTYSMLSSFYSGIGGNSGGGGMQKPPTAMAKGGSLYADRPTTVVFGEAGPEIAEFTPVSKMGKNENKVSTGNGTPASVANGRVAVRIDLSPDLIGKIEENTLNQAAEVLLEVQRRY